MLLCITIVEAAIEKNINDLVIFLDNIEQIPKERRLRKEYFQTLRELNSAMFDGFGAYVSIIYDQGVKTYGNRLYSDTEVLKEEFNDYGTALAQAGTAIIWHNKYSPEELFQYMLMTERFAEIFNEVFEYE